jgi:hypothetical protein
MWVLSDSITFVLMQVSLLVTVVAAFLNSAAANRPKDDTATGGGLKADATVVRGEPSMRALGATAGFAVVVIALINGSAFNHEKFWFKDFSVLINLLDTLAILYLCFWCGWSRTKIVAMFGEAKIDR